MKPNCFRPIPAFLPPIHALPPVVPASEEGCLIQFIELVWRGYASGALDPPLLFQAMCYAEGSPLEKVNRHILTVARHRMPVCLHGERGAGKELVARAIHNLSGREGEFVACNCASLESHDSKMTQGNLFGFNPNHGLQNVSSRGAPGLFARARNGTLFFDEVHALPRHAQELLLRVVETQIYQPAAGDPQDLQSNARLILATDHDLAVEIDAGHFLQTFHDRVKLFAIRVPALRDRRKDIPALLQGFAHNLKRYGQYSEGLFKTLLYYDWPGNVRELGAFVEATLPASAGEVMTLSDLNLMPLDWELVAGLKTAHLQYQDAVHRHSLTLQEQGLKTEIVRQTKDLLVQVFARLAQKPNEPGAEAEIQSCLERLQEWMKQTEGWKAMPDAPRPKNCHDLLLPCLGTEQKTRAVLKHVFEELRRLGIKLSSQHEVRRYGTFNDFFGISFDVLRKRNR